MPFDHRLRQAAAYLKRRQVSALQIKQTAGTNGSCTLPSVPAVYCLLLPLPREAVAVFTTDDERLDHLRLFEVPVELVQLRQPEREATGIRVASEVTHVFHHHKLLVELRLYEVLVLCNAAERFTSGQRACSQTTD